MILGPTFVPFVSNGCTLRDAPGKDLGGVETRRRADDRNLREKVLYHSSMFLPPLALAYYIP